MAVSHQYLATALLVIVAVASEPNVTFGHALLDQFMLDPGFTNLNHGSFGAVPKTVHQAQLTYMAQAEARPDDWFRGGYQTVLDRVRSKLAVYVNASSDDLVFVENVSAAINAVLRSLATGPSDTFLILSCAYAMVSNTLLWLQEQQRAKLVVVDINFPIQGDADIMDAVRAALEQHQQAHPNNPIKMAVFSHIVSIPAVRLPIQELAQLSKQYGVEQVLVDGAHALGHIPIDITAYQASGVDIYTSNGHKWLYCPKGTAFLWVKPTLQPLIAPTVVSSDWAPHDYMRDFLYTGTRDYTPFAALEATLDFRTSLGGDEPIYNHMANQARQGAAELQSLWGTRLSAPANMSDAMLTVELPACLGQQAAGLMTGLAQEHNIQIVVFQMPGGNRRAASALYPSGLVDMRMEESSNADSAWWVRISAQVYTELDDIRRVGSLVKGMCQPDKMAV